MRFRDLFQRERGLDFSERISAVLAANADPLACVRFLDSFQEQTFATLNRRYNDETFAKLLALKLTNLAAARYQWGSRHAHLFSHPILLMVDPANACQLGCPGCVHTTNKEYGALFDWPRNTLPLETYRAFLDRFGPFGFAAALYNYGEPLLNKRFPEIVRASRSYLLRTLASTNLSMPLDNAEEIVRSGLDNLILSIDGVTQPVYERYRRKGQLDLVLENVRKLVAAKKTLGSFRPHLTWQFLTFEHNLHELDDAMTLASRIGVDEFVVTTPFSVEFDDPTIRPMRSPREGTYVFRRWRIRKNVESRSGITEEIAGVIDRAFNTSWTARLEESAPENTPTESDTCGWLYFNMTMDGAGRIMPCCMAPDKAQKNLVFANFDPAASASALSIVNSPMAIMARDAFANSARRADLVSQAGASKPFCVHCVEKPSAPYSLESVRTDIRMLDPQRAVSDDLARQLTSWSSP